MNWWNTIGLACDILGAVGAGFDSSVWTRAAALDVIPGVSAMTTSGFGVPRLAYRARHFFYWSLITCGFILQLIGQFF
jgi:hypothetical protein